MLKQYQLILKSYRQQQQKYASIGDDPVCFILNVHV